MFKSAKDLTEWNSLALVGGWPSRQEIHSRNPVGVSRGVQRIEKDWVELHIAQVVFLHMREDLQHNGDFRGPKAITAAAVWQRQVEGLEIRTVGAD